MAVSRKFVPKFPLAQIQAHPLAELCDKRLLQSIHTLYSNLPPATVQQVAVALSGGVDSAALALHMAVWANALNLPLHCFHVHHGLQDVADQWSQHVQTLAHHLGASIHIERVHVDLLSGTGIEAAARDARYLAFQALCQRVGVHHLFVAHHQDDQAETVLLRLLRGSGPTGLGAMAPVSQREGFTVLRPWLDMPRSLLLAVGEQLTQHLSWTPVQDGTNVNDDYTRGAVRERLKPHLNERWPGWQKILTRHAKLSRDTAQLLEEVAAEDLLRLDYRKRDHSFDLKAWRELSAARQAQVMRHWLALAGLKMPTEARLDDMMRQMRTLHALGFDRHMQVKHGEFYVICRQGRVILQQYA
ncbi:tRNA lysidine(34) synthetase TilS [Paenalcaligenes suwonensis]|uniref:tRNA lysidine(34) synthetase TilS n=1 Tax=Paenalcaligenes suwonensis TaxID=1202713 RepID=UPI0014077BD3|nr:tRNA lysidine(34) synthetase TilS [Paenalcaligenes suwonensis]NHC62103.1 tRNA lysidine(34) synthetase TilS [Paenalcaligenes suwonensis]